ncbi:hypothetical protein GCM10018965_010720 [Nonomuraea roseola]
MQVQLAAVGLGELTERVAVAGTGARQCGLGHCRSLPRSVHGDGGVSTYMDTTGIDPGFERMLARHAAGVPCGKVRLIPTDEHTCVAFLEKTRDFVMTREEHR